ncbi:MAG: peptidylprolyl isomerase [Leptolyngbyaceae cyanobacterium RU_5_1]|nr:peptidylprolyl isomerase [Leptolyngbyaceae cyanobacterium RU_5_1]
MSSMITVSREEIIHQLKLSRQIPSMIEGVVHRKIIESKAQEVGIQVGSEELQQVADNFRLTHKLWKAEDTWAWLQEYYLSLEEFEKSIYITALSSKLAQHLFADQVEPSFVEHQLDYDQVLMYEIVLDDEDLAMELFYTIQEGEMSFHEVAHQYIQDEELRRAGGYGGALRRTDLKPEISAAVFAATPPQLLKPIVTSKGAHLILVEQLIRPELDDILRHNILSNLFLDWLKKQAAQVKVVTQLQPAALGQSLEPSYSSSAAG